MRKIPLPSIQETRSHSRAIAKRSARRWLFVGGMTRPGPRIEVPLVSPWPRSALKLKLPGVSAACGSPLSAWTYRRPQRARQTFKSK